MSDRLEDDLMEDLMAEPEGRSQHAMDEFDEVSEFDEASEFDELEESFDEGEEGFDEEGAEDELEEAVSDALDAEDFDEFWGKIGGFLKKVGRGVGSVARVVAPIASAIPIPQAQLIGRVAGMVGKVLADEGDEMDALEELADFGEDEATVRVAAPVVAGLAIRTGLKHHAARIAPAQRRQLVHAVTAATKRIGQVHGPRAVIAMPAIVHHARRVAVRRGLPASALPQLVRRIAQKAVRSPQVVRKLARTATRLRTGPGIGRRRYGARGVASGIGGTMTRGAYRSAGGFAGGMRGGAVCPSCGRRRSMHFRGPIRLTIESA
jgi:hypothetical protein